METGKGVTVLAELEAVALIALQLLTAFGVGYAVYLLLGVILGFRPSVELPWSARLLGLAPGGVGVAFGLYTLRYRHPREMLGSTAVTLMKLLGRRPVGGLAGRAEPFNPAGPYRYVRNPLYFGVVALVLGSGVALSSVLLLLWGAVVASWFWFFLIPFEEKELAMLFGERYERYRRSVPKLVPHRRGYREP